MFSFRRGLSAGTFGGVALLGLLVIASAPAASSRPAQQRAFLEDRGANVQGIRILERSQALSIQHMAGGSKLDGSLASLARSARPAGASSIRTAGLERARDGKVRVVIETRRPADTRALVERYGGRVERGSGNLVQAVVSPRNLSALSSASAVDRVRAPYRARALAVNGEEVAATLASAWHDKGFTGKGVKVAIIDVGFKGLAERQAEGDLPASVVTQDFCGGKFATAEDHGTAVAEIVHEMAPDAQLYLLCIDTDVDLANAEAYAKSQGVQIINHSVGWYGPWRSDGSGPIGAIVSDARANGILWVNAAGNDADTHWAGTFADSDGNRWLDWSSNGDEGNTFIWPNGAVICGFLKWDEWSGTTSDFDFGVFLSGANVLLAASAEDQTAGAPPYEEVCAQQTTGVDLVVFWAIYGYRVASSPRIDLFSWSPSLQYEIPAGSIDDPATSPASFAVGALCWQSKQLEFYSSQGPTVDGRVKPDIAGHDSVSGETYGGFSSCPSAFAGTSAASPEVAGAAALVRQAYPASGPDQLQRYLMDHALDIGAAGADNESGAGELRMPSPPDLVAPSAKALASVGRMGKTVRLVSTVSDDSGQVAVVELVKRNGRVIATLKRKGFVSASGPTRVAVVWKASLVKGAYQHCVRATDRGGNVSPVSCAKVVLK